jgi:hypothetical protein
VGGKGERTGGFWPNGHLLPPPRIRTEAGEGRLRYGWPAAIPGEPGHRGGRAAGQNEEGFTGIRFPYVPWAGMVCGGGSSGGSGLEVVVLGVAAL